MATNHDLRTAEGCQALYKDQGRNLRRDDFPAGAEGWAMWCDHRIRKHTAEITTAEKNLAYWKQVKAGEHMVHAANVIGDLEKANALVKKLQDELAKTQGKKS